ncbi:O-methyltransferase family protein [Euphorbia peplus]|nr:O-methyltransferase family protein [Euphorbia peplus]
MAMTSSSIKNNIVDDEEEEACLNAMIFATSLIFPVVLNTAIELDLFNIIAKSGPRAYVSASEIASHLPSTNPDAPSLLDRMLHLLVAHSLISYSPRRTLKDGQIEKTYALTPASKFFTGSVEQGMNVSSTSRLGCHKACLDSFLNLKDEILEGVNPFKKANGISYFEYMNKDEGFKNTFNQAMVGLSSVIMNGILAKYEGFEGLKSLVDVGGGTGKVLNMIISKYPSIKGINFDLPHVIQSALSYPGIQHIGGNMFTSIPKGEAIMIKNTCHNWNDETVIKILTSINEVLPKNGNLILIEALLPENPEKTKASQYVAGLDIVMFTNFSSGKERSAKEYEALTKAAGFANFKVACIAHDIFAVMESYK